MCWLFSPEWSLIKLVIPVSCQLIYYQIDKWCQYNQADVFLRLTNWYQWFTKWLLALWTQLTEVKTQPRAEVHGACSSLDQLGLADETIWFVIWHVRSQIWSLKIQLMPFVLIDYCKDKFDMYDRWRHQCVAWRRRLWFTYVTRSHPPL